MQNRLSGLLAIGIFFYASHSAAQSNDAEFRAMLKEGKTAEVEALALARLGKNAADEIAIWHLGNVTSNDAAKREETIKRAEACIALQPKASKCHSILGRMYGVTALSSGALSMLKYASKIKDAFLAAVEFDPSRFDARRDLNQYYLQAPGIAGGSVRKAIANADDFAKINAVQGSILRVEIHTYEKEFDKAEAILAAMKPTDEAGNNALKQAWASLGFAMISNMQAPKAQSLFERLLATDMNNATWHFGLGRALLENKSIDAAISALERALKIDPKMTAHYRLGMAYEAKGDKPKALAAFQQFLSYSSTGKAADDARQRIATLKQ